MYTKLNGNFLYNFLTYIISNSQTLLKKKKIIFIGHSDLTLVTLQSTADVYSFTHR